MTPNELRVLGPGELAAGGAGLCPAGGQTVLRRSQA
jgi:hypothetical protein